MTRAESGVAVPGPATGRPRQRPRGAAGSAEAGGVGQVGEHGGAEPQGDARRLTDVVARLRRVLRTSIRADYPWESLPMAQVELLQSLAETAPARVGDLAARLRLAPSTVSGLISQMINAGLVERGTDTRDRRVAVVALSEAGREQLTEWNAAHRRRIAAALAELDPAEREAIDDALPALARLVEQLAQQRDEARDIEG
ncbi:winged helix-turn-helix transcriptional regulator [Actinospica durhamensis]|uniref:Winged helix-turn-helix transcriptional regulator n=1 Tax=Actinospica durhamensis TaxID=1508375 RepID=A0A941ENM9_9ACTN|nr:MarR family winged helix-turn-helix transcriptional regulator [Actinospica durhamensis]MBR7835730.1 winged helix-turn-helix transcriptional regulator [Actinospica durhamensis]